MNRYTEDELDKYIRTLPKSVQALFERVLLFKKRGMQAIKAKCIDCVGFDSTRMLIRECHNNKCPLHHVRPYQIKLKE